MITPTTAKALHILCVQYDKRLSARQFAEKMWGESKSWKKMHNIGNGATHGSGMWLAAGSYLAKLEKKGLIYNWVDEHSYTKTWRTSEDGMKALLEYEAHQSFDENGNKRIKE